MSDASKGHQVVYFVDITGDGVNDDDWPVGTLAWDEELSQFYIRTGAGWQFVDAQVP